MVVLRNQDKKWWESVLTVIFAIIFIIYLGKGQHSATWQVLTQGQLRSRNFLVVEVGSKQTLILITSLLSECLRGSLIDVGYTVKLA